MSRDALARVRTICLGLPETSERMSHGEPTFFVGKRVFAMFSNHHHQDGHIAVVIPAPPGIQAELIAREPETFYRPPYVGGKGWIGIELPRIKTQELAFHIETAWEIAATPKIRASRSSRK